METFKKNIQVVFLTVFLVLSFLTGLNSVVYASEFHPAGFDFLATINLNFSVDSGTQINFNLTYSDLNSSCQPDFDDVRFYTLSGLLLSAYNETTVVGNYVEVWLKSDGEDSFYVAWGNPNASPYWNINAVFNDVIDGLVVALPFDSYMGATKYSHDYSGNDNDVYVGTYYQLVDGVYGDAMDCLDSHSASVAVSPSLSVVQNSTDISIVCWVKPYSGYMQDICGFFGYTPEWGYTFHCQGTGFIHLVSLKSGGSWYHLISDVPFVNNTWNFYGFSYDGVNGNQTVNSYVTSQAFGIHPNSSSPLYFGYAGFANSPIVIDHFLMFDSGLSDFQMGELRDYYPDVTLVEGSVCCRVWLNIMPSVSFAESTSDDATIAIALAVLGVTLAMCALAYTATARRK